MGFDFVGDLMAVADEGFGAGGGDKRRGKERGRKKLGAKSPLLAKEARSEAPGMGGDGADDCIGSLDKLGTGSSARKGREPQDDSIGEERVHEVGRKRLPPKRMGELSELDFLRKAMRMGMIVSKPWGDSYRYDFVCDTGGKLWRTQVRSTETRFGARGYAVHASVYIGKKMVGLTAKDIDVIVAYIASRNIWYVVPVKAFVPRKNLWFYPDGSKKGAMFEKFREAWWVMMGRKRR